MVTADSDNSSSNNPDDVDRDALIRFKSNQVMLNREVNDVIMKILQGMSDHEDRLRRLEGRE